MRRTFPYWMIFLASCLVACAAVTEQPSSRSEQAAHEVSVVHEGWHTALVLAQADIAATGLLPEAADFPNARYLEFGWGDRAYYTSADPSLAQALRAALLATPAVLHVAELSKPPRPVPNKRPVISVALTEMQFRSLVSAIAGTFTRSDSGRAWSIGSGLSARSRFYPAEGTFLLFNNCNTWAAKMLQSAGLDVSPAGVISPDDLMSQL